MHSAMTSSNFKDTESMIITFWRNIGCLEATSDYFIRLLAKFVRERAKSFDVTTEAQADFSEHTQQFMQGMVWTGQCRSWCKQIVFSFYFSDIFNSFTDLLHCSH